MRRVATARSSSSSSSLTRAHRVRRGDRDGCDLDGLNCGSGPFHRFPSRFAGSHHQSGAGWVTVHRPYDIPYFQSNLAEDDPGLFRRTLCAHDSDNAPGARKQISLRDVSLEARCKLIRAHSLPKCEANGASNEVHTRAQWDLVSTKISAAEASRQFDNKWLTFMEDDVSLHDPIADAHAYSCLLNQVAH